MKSQSASPQLQAIAICLSQEICRPLDTLQAGLVRLLDDPARPPSDAERAHAQTMLTLCDELRHLTLECLGDDSGAEPPEESQVSRSASAPISVRMSEQLG